MSQKTNVVIGKARFSLITPNVIRLQYAPFDDRSSLQVITRPPAIAFDPVIQSGDQIALKSEHFTIHYKNDGPFSPDSG